MLKAAERVVVYRRTSTRNQNLGLDAQEADIARYLAATGARRIATFEEQESGKVRSADRPELAKAIAECKVMKATLLCGKVDRMGRRRADMLTLIDESGVLVAFADEPHASSLSIGVKAVVAHEEGEAISARTKAALAAAKAKGVKLGNPLGAKTFEAYRTADKAAGGAGNTAATQGAKLAADKFAANLRPKVEAMIGEGKGNAQIAAVLNEQGVPTRREGARWYEMSVRNLRARLGI
jgi:DNA invertase Pin-like site-specific DNA recombinase